MVTSLKKIVKLLGNFFLLYLSLIVPKDKSLWVFGSWFGKKYADNSRYLFEYVIENETEIKAAWLTHDITIYNQLKNQDIPVYYINSFKGYWICCRASIAFFSQGTWDVNRLGLFRTIKVQLWHGYPNKKNATKVNLSEGKNIFTKLKVLLLKPHHWYDYTVTCNELAGEIRMNSFNMKKEQVLLTGYPRTDIILNKNRKNNNKKIIGFFPTYRPYNFKIFENDVLDKINEYLIEKDMYMYIKLHPADKKSLTITNDKRIILLKDNTDVNDVLVDIDILLTDYSSVFFDFLILNRPIIFTTFDKKKYIEETGGFWDNFDERPGKQCKDWEEVIREIDQLSQGKDNWRNKRLQYINTIYKYIDANNRKRLVDFFR